MIPYIFNIQKFSLHDGPGIRTTVFFKGCPLACRWCHNPESQRKEPEFMTEEDGRRTSVGQQYTVRELVKLLKKDIMFYDQSGGGVTLSGGEVMIQDMDYIVELMRCLQREGISVAVDTSGQTPKEHFEKILPFTDLFLYDLKMIDSNKHREYTGAGNEFILDNLKYLSEHGAKIELRMIMIKGVNISEEDISRMIQWFKSECIRISQITLLPYHDFGRDKYRKLGRECTQNYEKPAPEELERVKHIFETAGYKVKISE